MLNFIGLDGHEQLINTVLLRFRAVIGIQDRTQSIQVDVESL